MSEIDLAILAVIAISVAISYMRGFFREATSLLSWVIAIGVTLIYTSRFASILPIDSVHNPVARATISALTLFLGTLLMGHLINWVFARAMARSSVGKADKLLGALFGATRGVIIASLLVLAANMVPELKQESWWRDSTLLPQLQKVAQFVHSHLPEGIGQHFDFS